MSQQFLDELLIKLGVDDLEGFLKALDTALDEAETKAKSGGAVGGKAFSDQFVDSARRNAPKGFGRDFISALGIETIGTFLGNTLANAFQGALQAGQQFVSDSNREFRSYQIALNTLSVSGVQDLESIKTQIKGLSAESKVFSENEIAQALAEMIKAGLDAGTAIEFVRSSINVARSEIDPATGELGDLRKITLQLSDVMSAFGIETKDAAKTTDILAKGALDSKLSISELSQAIAPVGALAKTSGLSLEQVVGTLSALRQTGIPASEAATQLRTVLQASITPAGAYKKQMEDLGLTVVRADGSIRPFPELLDNIARVAQSGGKGLQFLSTTFGSYGVNAAISLGKSRQAINEQADALSKAEGEGKKFGDGMLKGVEDAKAFEAQIKNAKLALGAELQPVLVVLYRDILPEVIKQIEPFVSKLAQIAAIIKDLREGTGKTSIVGKQLAEQFEGKFTDPDKAAQLSLQIDKTNAKLKDAQANLNKIQQGVDLLGKTPLKSKLLENAQNEIAGLQKQLGDLEKQLGALERKPTSSPTPSSPIPTSKPTPAAPIPDLGKGKPGKPGKPKDEVIEQINQIEDRFKLFQNRVELSGGLDKVVGDPKKLAEYKGQLTQIEKALDVLASKATTTERKLALQGAQLSLKQTRDAITKALDDQAEKQKKDADERKRKAAQEFKQSLDDIQRDLRAFQKQFDSEQIGVQEYEKALARLQNRLVALGKTAQDEGEKDSLLSVGDSLEGQLKRVADLPESVIRTIRSKFKTIQEALEAGFDFDLVARAFPQEFADNLDKALNTVLEQSKSDAGPTRYGEQFGQIGGEASAKAFADFFNQYIRDRANQLIDLSPLTEAVKDEITKLGGEVLPESQLKPDFLAPLDPKELAKTSRDELLAIFREAKETGAVELANAVEEALKIQEEAIPRVEEPLREFDTTVANSTGELGKLEVAIGAIQTAYEAIAQEEDPLQLMEMLDLLDDNLFEALDALDARIESLAPDDPELARLQQMRNQLEKIIALRSQIGFFPGFTSQGSDINRPQGDGKPPGKTNTEKSEYEKSLEKLQGDIASTFIGSARGFLKELLDGTPDIGAALSSALGTASDFFLNKMLEGILGPIAKELGEVAAEKLFSKGVDGALSLNPVGAGIGVAAIVASLLFGMANQRPSAAQQASQDAAKARTTPSSLSLKVETAISVYMEGTLDNANNRASLTTLVENINMAQLRKLGVFELIEELKRSRK